MSSLLIFLLLSFVSAAPQNGAARSRATRRRDFILTSTDRISLTRFLTDRVTYAATSPDVAGKKIPLSFFTPMDYIGRYLCNPTAAEREKIGKDLPSTCTVRYKGDSANPEDNDPGFSALVERVNMIYGTNIYDAACWQIAMALEGNKRGQRGGNFTKLANDYMDILLSNHFANQRDSETRVLTKASDGANRLIFNGVEFNPDTNPEFTQANSYFFRMFPQQWMNDDPFAKSAYHALAAKPVPWLDWKPVAGENAWANYVGPLQAYYLNTQYATVCPDQTNKRALENAMNVLTMVSVMQAQKVGGIIYTPQNAYGNQGTAQDPGNNISVENNASMLAGLVILRTILDRINVANCGFDAAQVEKAKSRLTYLLFGGQNTVRNYNSGGLLGFFRDYAWDKAANTFVTGGIVKQNGRGNVADDAITFEKFQDDTQAVDVNTWTTLTVGAKFIDTELGKRFGTAFDLWQKTKAFGGYFAPNGTLLGVGYSNKDQNKMFSAEWTFGAIAMVQHLHIYYTRMKQENWIPAENTTAQVDDMLNSLARDFNTMSNGVHALKADDYESSPLFDADRPEGYDKMYGYGPLQNAFLYAQKRYLIPFGWFANPIGSTTSTAWALMMYHKFNPFQLGGNFEVFDWWIQQ